MNNEKFVNVFQGTGKSVTPENGSLFSKWNLLKGKAGNTSPAACLPFGNVTCSPYSGGYSTGYGNFKRNGGLPPEKFFEGDKIIGFSHFTHSGCGAFGFYYNYLVVLPYTDELQTAQELKNFDNETACPGYYSCRLTDENINCEVTVSDKVALHRYKADKPLKLAVDISNNGLQQKEDKGVYSYSTESEMRIDGNGVSGFITMQGVKIYYHILCKGKATLWLDGTPVEERRLHLRETQERFGVTFETDGTGAELKIGFSLVGETNAMAAAMTAPDFDTAVKRAGEAWREKLSATELYGVSDEDREIFYSNFYHTLVKPNSWKQESFLWDEKETFYHDFATLWDIYKTQTPLVFALYPEVGKGIVKTFLHFGKEKGMLVNALMLNANMNVESTQACCLGCYALYDAYAYGLVEEKQIDDLFAVVKADVAQYREAVLSGTMEKTTKLLDVTLISAAFAELAKERGRAEDEKYFAEIAERWTDAFGADGLLKADYPYYEGNRWNYSFRFVKDIEKRIVLAGGKERLTKQLDAFFAFTDENDLRDRFEGFNNETDMETPYFYHYVGRYDRIAEIMAECTNACFKTGREGMPGNADSGGLTACYLWNFLGLFPISGQDSVFLGVPKAEKAVLHLGNGKTLTIVNESKGAPKKIIFNSKEITGYTLPVNEILRGGELRFA